MNSARADVPSCYGEVFHYLPLEEEIPLHNVIAAGIRLDIGLPQGTRRRGNE